MSAPLACRVSAAEIMSLSEAPYGCPTVLVSVDSDLSQFLLGRVPQTIPSCSPRRAHDCEGGESGGAHARRAAGGEQVSGARLSRASVRRARCRLRLLLQAALSSVSPHDKSLTKSLCVFLRLVFAAAQVRPCGGALAGRRQAACGEGSQ
eukprot:6192756-Pleurochrysis_carterae.AAC.8